MVKFLIIRFSSIGDIVLTSPVIRCLKKQVENAEIHFLTKKAFLPVVKANPHIDRIWLLEDRLSDLIPHLRNEKFDHIIDLHNNIRSFLVKFRLRTSYFSLDKINMARLLMINFKINRLPDKHIVDRYMETLSLFDVQNDGKGLEYFIPEEDHLNLNSFPPEFQKGYLAVVTGAQHGTKQMPVKKMIDICNGLDMPLILLGGNKEKSLGEEIANNTGDHVLNCCGKYNLNQSAFIVSRANAVISPDTGMMHIAAAFKKKIISVWGHTIPEFGMYPYQPDSKSKIFEVKGLSCRPCTKIGKEKCPKGHFRCMNDLPNSEIISAATELFTVQQNDK